MAQSQRYLQLIQQQGKLVAHTLFPKDFEFYAFSLELVDSSDRTVDVLTFPVMPQSLRYDDQPVRTTTKTAGGVSSLFSTSFNPRSVSITATFGRRERILIGGINNPRKFSDMKSTSEGAFGSIRDGLRSVVNVFDPSLKTGYGATKILESMINKHKQLDDKNQPLKLFMYNPSFGQSFLVTVSRFSPNMNMSNNMFWSFDLELDIIAPLDRTGKDQRGTLVEATLLSTMQAKVNNLAGSFRNQL